MANNWYQDLLDKEVIITGIFDQDIVCFISGFDYDFGFTLQEKDSNRYIFCYRGPSAKVPGYISAERSHKHRKYISTMAKEFRKGKTSKDRINLLYFSIVHGTNYGQVVDPASANTCPFSQ